MFTFCACYSVFIVETDSDEHKTEEADCVKAAIDSQKTTVNKPEELTTPSPTQPSCPIVVISQLN